MNCSIPNEKIKKVAEEEGVSVEKVEKIKAWLDSLNEHQREELEVTPTRIAAKWANRGQLQVHGKPVEVIDYNDYRAWYTDGSGEVKSIPLEYIEHLDGAKAEPYLREYKSAAEFTLDSRTGFETIGRDLLNNPEKFMELGREIDEADSVDIDPDHRRNLFNALGVISSLFREALPQISVHLNKAYRETGGVIEINPSENKADLFIGISPNSGNRSALETYVHELLHAAIDFALNSKIPEVMELIRNMERILEEFINTTTADDLAKFMDNPATAVHDAEKILEYVSTKGLKEFIPHALSNKAVMARLREMQTPRLKENPKNKAYTYKIIMFIRKVFNAIFVKMRKEPTANDLARMGWLVSKLVTTNIRQLQNKEKSVMGKVGKTIDRVEEGLKKFAAEKKGQVFNKDIIDIPMDASTPTKLLKMGQVAVGSFFNDKLKLQAELIASSLGQSPEGVVQTIMRNSNTPDELMKVIEAQGLLSNNIDRNREEREKIVIETMKDTFGRKLTSKELAGLDKVLIADLNVLDDLAELVKDEQNVQNAINEIEAKLENEFGLPLKNYYKGQSLALARYMLTGQGGITLLKNAKNIAMRINDVSKTDEVTEETVKDIDRLVSLYALQQTDKYSKEAIQSLLAENADGIKEFQNQINAMKESSKELFKALGDEYFEIKGYHKDLYPNNMDLKVAPMADMKKYESMGYKLIGPLKNHSLHKRADQMGLYVNAMPVNPNYQKVGLRITDKKHRGFSVTESYDVEVNGDLIDESVAYNAAKRDIAKLATRMAEVIDKQKNGDFTIDEEDENIHPMINAKGEISNFSYEMSRQDKVDLLGLNTNAIETLAYTVSSVYDRVETVKHNMMMIDTVMRDARNQNLKVNDVRTMGKNLKEYMYIGPNTDDPKAKEYWALLPKELRNYINENNDEKDQFDENGKVIEYAKKGFYIRRDSLLPVMGFRELTVSRSKAAQKFPTSLKYAIDISEAIWKGVVMIAKRNIVIKIPTVLVNNVISNTWLLSIMSGGNLFKAVRYQLDGVKELNSYLEVEKKIIKLETKAKAGVITELEKKKLALFKAQQVQSGIKELIDAGFYTNIIEETDERDAGSSNVVEAYMDKQFAKLPLIVQSGMSFIMFDKKSRYYKAMNQATQYSDFVGRYAKHKMNLAKGMSMEESIANVRDAFVNYNLADSPKWHWLNTKGAVLFTKYFINVQRFVAASIRETPIRVLGGLLALNFMWADAPNPWESTVLTDGPWNRLSNPFDLLETASTPGLVSVYDSMSHI